MNLRLPLVPHWLALLLALTFGLAPTAVSWAQGNTADGRLSVTVRDAQGQAVPSTPVALRTEGEELLGSCTTDPQGRCTIALQGVPADASGFIRGSVRVGAAQRPVLWPGGDLTLAIQLDASGQIDAPTDVLATRSPVATYTPGFTIRQATARAATFAAGTPSPVQATGTPAAVQHAPSPSVSPAAPDAVATTAAPDPTSAAPPRPFTRVAQVLGLGGLFLGGVAGYHILSTRGGGR